MTTLSDPMNYIAYQTSPSMGFCRQEYWRGLPFFLQGIFQTQGSNLCLFHRPVDSWPLCTWEAGIGERSQSGLENVPPRSRLFWEPLQSPLFSGTHVCIFKDAFFSPLVLFWFDVGLREYTLFAIWGVCSVSFLLTKYLVI